MSCHYSNFLYELLICLFISSLCGDVFANVTHDCQENAQYHKQHLIDWPKNQFKQPIDKEYWLTIKQAKSLPNDVVWVDVRSKLTQINNSLNILIIPLNQLENTHFLFDKTVVLIGTGFDQVLINNAINTLKVKGFKHLFALSGGIRVWHELQQPKITISDEILPEEFLLGGESITWHVITVGLTTTEINTLPEKPLKRLDLSKQSILALNHFLPIEAIKNDAFIRYVLIAPNEQITLLLKRQLSIPESHNLVWLKGGLSNYQYYIQQQTNLINNAEQSLSKPCRLTL
ncbi:rhodanese-like domain-containing protein [Orbus sturtevantii]|uniref:rhodanese-like domain-containing protein n=1 Tax=Orbus sturtevantii TaxID=3074109 RepID=UPI00370D76E1